MNKFAVVKINNAQFQVTEGDEIDIQKISGEKGDKIKFTDVLLVSTKEKTEVGTPVVKDVVVNAEIVNQVLGEKIKMMIYKAKSRFRKRKGHRQQFTRIKITSIK